MSANHDPAYLLGLIPAIGAALLVYADALAPKP
jgi:hypothetical protein